MRRRKLYFLLIIVCLFLGSTQPTWAYYDEVHYALTFYIAREMGFTPQQAIRIASGCVSVDYGPDSEPVQGGSLALQLLLRTVRRTIDPRINPLTHILTVVDLEEVEKDPGMLTAADPQWRFHAFRDLKRFPGTALADSATAADRAIHDQREALWNEAIKLKNPGFFLHFYEDEIPHNYYGTIFGHWVLPSGSTLPMGSTVDWLSYKPTYAPILVMNVEAELSRYLRTVVDAEGGPPDGQAKQHLVQIDLSRVQPALDAMFKVNPYPPGISSWGRVAVLKGGAGLEAALEDQRSNPFSWQQYIKELGFLGAIEVDSHLGGPPSEDEIRNIEGPDTDKAIEVLNEALGRDGLLQSGIGIPHSPFKYPIQTMTDGFQAKFFSKDATTLVGTLQVRIVEKKQAQVSGDVAPSSVQVDLYSVPAGPVEKEYKLASQTESPQGDIFHYMDFTGVPIGQVRTKVLFTYPDGSTRDFSKTVPIDMEVNDVVLDAPDLARGKLHVSVVDAGTGDNLWEANVLVKGDGKTLQSETTYLHNGADFEVPVTNSTAENTAAYIPYQILVTKSGYRPGTAGPVTIQADASNPTQIVVRLIDLSVQTARGEWGGTYVNGTTGAYYTLTINGLGNALSATTARQIGDGGSDTGTWQNCAATTPTTIHCDWQSRWEDDAKIVRRHGTVDATISADNNKIQTVSNELTNGGTGYANPGDVLWKIKTGPWYLSSMHNGAIWNDTWTRK